MEKETAANIGTAFVLYQAVFEVLGAEAQFNLKREAQERFTKFDKVAGQIDEALVAESDAVEANCVKFCRMALDGIFDFLEDSFPENATE